MQLTIIGKPGCHLCDDARMVIDPVVADLASRGADIQVVERSILDEPDLRDRWADEIPVVMIDGMVHTYWRVDPARLRAALEQKL